MKSSSRTKPQTWKKAKIRHSGRKAQVALGCGVSRSMVDTTDYEHPEKAFFENPELLGLGRQIGPKILGAFWVFSAKLQHPFRYCESLVNSRVSNIESDNSQNVGLEDYNIISDGIFPHFTTPSIKIGLG